MRGFISTLTLQLIGAAGAVALVVGLWAYVSGLRDSLEACERTNLVLNQEVEWQNNRVKEAEEATAKALKRGKAALAKAKKTAASAESEISRLRSAKSGTSCVEAVKEIRKGLRD